jgi:hypothetical protein
MNQSFLTVWQSEQLRLKTFEKPTEKGGFEPPIPKNQYNGLANRRFQPLSHLSKRAACGFVFKGSHLRAH